MLSELELRPAYLGQDYYTSGSLLSDVTVSCLNVAYCARRSRRARLLPISGGFHAIHQSRICSVLRKVDQLVRNFTVPQAINREWSGLLQRRVRAQLRRFLSSCRA